MRQAGVTHLHFSCCGTYVYTIWLPIDVGCIVAPALKNSCFIWRVIQLEGPADHVGAALVNSIVPVKSVAPMKPAQCRRLSAPCGFASMQQDQICNTKRTAYAGDSIQAGRR